MKSRFISILLIATLVILSTKSAHAELSTLKNLNMPNRCILKFFDTPMPEDKVFARGHNSASDEQLTFLKDPQSKTIEMPAIGETIKIELPSFDLYPYAVLDCGSAFVVCEKVLSHGYLSVDRIVTISQAQEHSRVHHLASKLNCHIAHRAK